MICDVAASAAAGTVATERDQDLQPGQRKLVLILVARRAQRVAGREHRLGRHRQIASGQGDGTGDDLEYGPVHRPGGEVEIHGTGDYFQCLVPAAKRGQRLGLVDREQAAGGAGEQLRVRAHGGPAGRLGGTFVFPGPLEQVRLVDRRVQQDVVGASALGHGPSLRDQVEGTAVRGRLLARVGVEHGQRQQRVRLFRLVAGPPGERKRLLRVGPFVGHLRRTAGQREQDVHPDARRHVAGHVIQGVFQVPGEVPAAELHLEVTAIPEQLRDPFRLGGGI